jgi:hypothetical protein
MGPPVETTEEAGSAQPNEKPVAKRVNRVSAVVKVVVVVVSLGRARRG